MSSDDEEPVSPSAPGARSGFLGLSGRKSSNPSLKAPAGAAEVLMHGWIKKRSKGQAGTVDADGKVSGSLKQTKKGALQAKLLAKWDVRYAVLSGGAIVYYKKPEDFEAGKDPQGEIPLDGATVRYRNKPSNAQFKPKFKVAAVTKKGVRVFSMLADSETDQRSWVTLIKQEIRKFDPAAAAAAAGGSMKLGDRGKKASKSMVESAMDGVVAPAESAMLLADGSTPAALLSGSCSLEQPLCPKEKVFATLTAVGLTWGAKKGQTERDGGFSLAGVRSIASPSADTIHIDLGTRLLNLVFSSAAEQSEWAAAISENSPARSGWLAKTKGASKDGYQARWFVLQEQRLFYYESDLWVDAFDLATPSSIKGVIQLAHIKEMHLEYNDDTEDEREKSVLALDTHWGSRTMLLQGQNEQDIVAWRHAIAQGRKKAFEQHGSKAEFSIDFDMSDVSELDLEERGVVTPTREAEAAAAAELSGSMTPEGYTAAAGIENRMQQVLSYRKASRGSKALPSFQKILLKMGTVAATFEGAKETFDKFDADKNGTIEPSEALACVQSIGLDTTQEAVDDIFRLVDPSGNTHLDLQHFLVFLAIENVVNEATPVVNGVDFSQAFDAATDAFLLFDIAGKGVIVVSEVGKIISENGGGEGVLTVERMHDLDKDADGYVTFAAFLMGFLVWAGIEDGE